jgi:HTH-type transcriptional repressor of NAD biosynthesis genes
VAFLCRCVLGVEVDAVFTSEDYGDGFAASLESAQREHNPGAPSVAHICVDRARDMIPISATSIRADVHAHRQWLSPEVYASFVRRVCILGGESSGKSTLAKELAAALDTTHVAEYGRLLWEEKAGTLAFDDMLRIAETQIMLEESAAGSARELLICDTSPLTTMLYSEHLFGRVDPALERMATSSRYDLTVLCAPDFPFVQDGTRQDDVFRRFQHQWYLDKLEARGDRWVLVRGSVEQRVRTVSEHLHAAAAPTPAISDH